MYLKLDASGLSSLEISLNYCWGFGTASLLVSPSIIAMAKDLWFLYYWGRKFESNFKNVHAVEGIEQI